MNSTPDQRDTRAATSAMSTAQSRLDAASRTAATLYALATTLDKDNPRIAPFARAADAITEAAKEASTASFQTEDVAQFRTLAGVVSDQADTLIALIVQATPDLLATTGQALEHAADALDLATQAQDENG